MCCSAAKSQPRLDFQKSESLGVTVIIQICSPVVIETLLYLNMKVEAVKIHSSCDNQEKYLIAGKQLSKK